MAYQPPPFVKVPGIDEPSMRFIWDDSRASLDFRLEADALVDRLLGTPPRAQVAAGIGMYEWILARFRHVLADPLPSHVAEAAWCASVSPAYMHYLELPRSDWRGPVRGPSWCAITWLMPMLFLGRQRPEEYESGLRYLSRLALHVLPRRQPFDDWLAAVADRLAAWYPSVEDDIFSGLFDDADAPKGEFVAPEAIDPGRPHDPRQARYLLGKYLAEVDPTINPLLRSAAEMMEAGFDGVPYSLGAP